MTTAPSPFPPSRADGLSRLAGFVPRAGPAYATGRNADPGPDDRGAVSRLSPYVRYRLVTEREIVAAILDRHSLSAAEKFVQEILWRSYWKGWLEQRPAIWSGFLAARDQALQQGVDRRALDAAERGETGIDGFDAWVRELHTTGYLHNHARMWFASIWIFTLRLPWALGADHFLRHLIDADPASNTLSWRWVAGLQTIGKTYLATADNIARYTGGRFAPKGLATQAVALTEPPLAPPRSLTSPAAPIAGQPALLLITPEDLHPESTALAALPIAGIVVAAGPALLCGEGARAFVAAAARDAATRGVAQWHCPADVAARLDAATLIAAASAAGVRQIVTPYAPVGPVATALARLAPALAAAGISLAQPQRSWDTRFWPHATKGFFAFRKRIPELLRAEMEC